MVSLVSVSERRIDRKIKEKQLNRPKIERTRGPERPQHTDEERGKPRQEQRAERRELAARQHVRRSNAGSEVGAGPSAEGTVRRRRAPVEEPAAAPAIAKEMATAAPLAQQVEEESEERPARRRKRGKPHRQQGARTAPGFLARTAAAVGVAARRAAQTGASVARGAAAAAATATTAPAKAIRTRLGGDEERQRRRLRKKLDRAAATHQVRHWAGGREIVDALLYRPPKSAEWGKPGSVERMQYVLELIRADNRRLPALTSAGRKHAAEARRVIDAVVVEQWNLCHPSGAESIYTEAESRHEARSDPPAPAPTAPPKQTRVRGGPRRPHKEESKRRNANRRAGAARAPRRRPPRRRAAGPAAVGALARPPTDRSDAPHALTRIPWFPRASAQGGVTISQLGRDRETSTTAASGMIGPSEPGSPEIALTDAKEGWSIGPFSRTLRVWVRLRRGPLGPRHQLAVEIHGPEV